MSEWKPIETAPKTPFELVLLADRSNLYERSDDGEAKKIGYKWDTVVGFWSETKQGWFLAECRKLVRSGRKTGHGFKIHNPTHWQPLPEPPK